MARFVARLAGKGLAVAVLLVPAAPVRAAIAVLAHGGTLKVDSVRVDSASDSDRVTLILRGGGEVELPQDQLVGVVPDEVIEEVEAARSEGGPLDLRALAAEVARRHGLPPSLVEAVIQVESAFRTDAVSPKGAQGLMQLMPGTAKELGVQDALDPAQNLDAGSRYLAGLLEKYQGDLPMALAAYNAGAGAVDRHRGVPPYQETKDYVKKVLSRYRKEGGGS